ncbi:serine/threonine-protein kinase M1 [Chytridiales sp. JEL 0842]|nr:serine/threonine-protein kinase M1 [Chytridiales sp. JEL 0842]
MIETRAKKRSRTETESSEAATSTNASPLPTPKKKALGKDKDGSVISSPVKGKTAKATTVELSVSQNQPGKSTTSKDELISVEEMALYDRQIRLWGLEAQTKMRRASILIVGVTGLTNEICKNIVLAGVGSLTIADERSASAEDLGAQFFLGEDAVGKNIAEAILPRVAILNPRVKLTAYAKHVLAEDDTFFGQFDLVLTAAAMSVKDLDYINQACRRSETLFMSAWSFGYFGYMFSDLINYDYIEERSEGNETKTVKRSKKTDVFIPLKDTLSKNWKDAKLKVIKKVPVVYFAIQLLWEFDKQHGFLPRPNNANDIEALKTIREEYVKSAELPAEHITANVLTDIFLTTLCLQAQTEISPVCAIMGGMVAQEVLGAISRKEVNVNNFFCYSAMDGVGSVVPIFRGLGPDKKRLDVDVMLKFLKYSITRIPDVFTTSQARKRDTGMIKKSRLPNSIEDSQNIDYALEPTQACYKPTIVDTQQILDGGLTQPTKDGFLDSWFDTYLLSKLLHILAASQLQSSHEIAVDTFVELLDVVKDRSDHDRLAHIIQDLLQTVKDCCASLANLETPTLETISILSSEHARTTVDVHSFGETPIQRSDLFVMPITGHQDLSYLVSNILSILLIIGQNWRTLVIDWAEDAWQVTDIVLGVGTTTNLNILHKILPLWETLIRECGYVPFPFIDTFVGRYFSELLDLELQRSRESENNERIEKMFGSCLKALHEALDIETQAVKETVYITATRSIYAIMSPELFTSIGDATLKNTLLAFFHDLTETVQPSSEMLLSTMDFFVYGDVTVKVDFAPENLETSRPLKRAVSATDERVYASKKLKSSSGVPIETNSSHARMTKYDSLGDITLQGDSISSWDVVDSLVKLWSDPRQLSKAASLENMLISSCKTVCSFVINFANSEEATVPDHMESLIKLIYRFIPVLTNHDNSSITLRVLSWKLMPEYLQNHPTVAVNPHQFLWPFIRIAQMEEAFVLLEVAKSLGSVVCLLANSNITDKDLLEKTSRVKTCKLYQDGETDIEGSRQRVSIQDIASYGILLASENDPAVRHFFMKSLKHILRHVPYNDLRIDSSPLLRDVLSCMESADRQLRLYAGLVLPSLFPRLTAEQAKEYGEILDKNIVEFVTTIKRIFDKDVGDVRETLILSIGTLARNADEDLLLHLLFGLVDQMARSSTALKALAFTQIKGLAKHLRKTTYDLVCPFLKEISSYLLDFKDHQILGEFAVLLNMKLEDFLRKTLEFTLPHLVLNGKHTVITTIATFLKVEVPIMCVEELHSIFCAMFLSDVDLSRAIPELILLLKADSNDKEINLTTLLKTCALKLVANLAVELGDMSETRRVKAINALKIVESRLGQSSDDRAQHNSTDVSGLVENYFLVKLKILRSLSEIMKLLGTKIVTVGSQILATLQTSLEFEELRDTSLHAWNTFVKTLSIADIGPLLNQIVAILLKHFPSFTSSQQHQTLQIFNYVIIDNQEMLRRYFDTIFAFPKTPQFDNLNKELNQEWSPKNPLSRLKHIITSVAHENPAIAEISLRELRDFLEHYQDQLRNQFLEETDNDVMNTMIKTLLDTLRKYSGSRLDLQVACCQCLGVLGAPDPARISISINQDVEILSDAFSSLESTSYFACKLIERQLVPAFRSANNTKTQDHLAFAIQELLRLCEFTPELADTERSHKFTDGKTERLHSLWKSFPKSVVDVIRPLLTAKYTITYLPMRPLQYPIYPSKATFKDWLQAWVVDMILKVNGDYAKKLFSVCKNVVTNENMEVALYLLPHLVLHVLTNGSSNEPEEILAEFMAVLNNLVSSDGSEDIEKHQLSSQTIFSLVDHLTLWIRSRRLEASRRQQAIARKNGRFISAEDGEDEKDIKRQRVELLLTKIPQMLMAEASYRCKAYTRALMHFEQYIREQRKDKDASSLQGLYGFMQKIYACIDESDGMEGISTLFLAATLEQQILEHESAGRWAAAQTSYEIALQKQPNSIKLHIGLLNCLKHLGHIETMLTHVKGLISLHPEWSLTLNSYGVEASSKLGQWESLGRYLKHPFEPRFEASIGDILYQLRCGDKQKFDANLRKAQETLIPQLSAASMESYSRCYDYLLKLNMLYEVESISIIQNTAQAGLLLEKAPPRLEQIVRLWESRLKITVPSLKVREPILSLRRALLTCPSEMMHVWIQAAKSFRKAGHYQPAYSAILHATDLDHNGVVVLEKCKWLKDTNEPHKAMAELQGFLNQVGADKLELQDNEGAISAQLIKAKALLMMARCMEDTGAGSSAIIGNKYQKAVAALKECEKGFFFMGRFYNKLLENEMGSGDIRLRNISTIIQVCKSYGRAITLGTRYIYQTLPRLLTLWLDTGTAQAKRPEQFESENSSEKGFMTINGIIRRLLEKVPAYIFFTALPQLVSRICHINRNVHAVLELILITVFREYPQQTIWHLVSVSKSRYNVRSSRCNAIFAKIKSKQTPKRQSFPAIENFTSEALKLTDALLHLCNYPIPEKETTLNLGKDFRNLQKCAGSPMILPIQKALAVSLSSDGASAMEHNPFPNDRVTFLDFFKDVEVMNSLQKPRKLMVLGSDSRQYIFLLKPKDDLRKDARLMEFNGLINKLMKKDAETRRRNLLVRTYAVVPLNEECGIIEWVENTTGFRHIIVKAYRNKNGYFSPQDVKALLDRKTRPVDEIFTTMVLPKFPPVFHEWFLETFPEPTKWFASRLAYAATVAVMSMVGYIVGLGDRHGENILFDEQTGECIHVDLNCLFEKGTTFEKPEKVPFRLTHNMVDAFGVTGVFRKACEHSLRVLRCNRELLNAVLETFIHDPLCEWSKRSSTTSRTSLKETQGETENEEAVKHLRIIGEKLKGQMKPGLPLSVEGQVAELIKEATNPKNLAVMYIGWAPFL